MDPITYLSRHDGGLESGLSFCEDYKNSELPSSNTSRILLLSKSINHSEPRPESIIERVSFYYNYSIIIICFGIMGQTPSGGVRRRPTPHPSTEYSKLAVIQLPMDTHPSMECNKSSLIQL
jgi:hypothetical protein